jgi:hypothetical protein
VVGLQLEKGYRGFGILFLGVLEPRRYLEKAPLMLLWGQVRQLCGNPAYGALSMPLAYLNKDAQLIYSSGARVATEA